MSILFLIFKLYDAITCRILRFIVQKRFEYYCRNKHITLGKNVRATRVCPFIECRDNSKIIIGDNVVFTGNGNTSWYCNTYLSCRGNGLIDIKNNVGMNGGMITCNDTHITIGKFTHIGGGTRIYDSNFHSLSFEDRRDPLKDCALALNAPLVIEEDVFIGTNCIIGKGVTIGARSIIAAGSVVVAGIPSDCIAGGNPCKIIKQINSY